MIARHRLTAIAATALFVGGAVGRTQARHCHHRRTGACLPDFANLPYANPDAPKGGNIGYGVVGTFDNFNPFILKSMRTTARGVIDTSLWQSCV